MLSAGKQKEQILTLERSDDSRKEDQRLVVTLLHHNRYLYRLETRPAGATAFTRKYQVGATKEGEPFANVPKGPECIVCGGKGTHRGDVTRARRTTSVARAVVTSSRTDPEKYVKEYEAKK